MEPARGVHRFQLECSGWHATGNWTKDVKAGEAARVWAFVDAALAAQEGPASFRRRVHRGGVTGVGRCR
ncbi:hypothetical protein [Streptomyces sp. NPDC058622]|uniref:hypothetical protein n=1 Tax=Streptomyces sp. NPDC058622 TaxID=3346562 RepID=UPI0036513DDB